MTQNQLLTYGSVAFAGFAAWYALRKTGIVAPLTGEQQRMQGTADWMSQNAAQNKAVNAAASSYRQSLNAQFAAQPDFYI